MHSHAVYTLNLKLHASLLLLWKSSKHDLTVEVGHWVFQWAVGVFVRVAFWGIFGYFGFLCVLFLSKVAFVPISVTTECNN